MKTWTPAATANNLPLQGLTLGEKGRCCFHVALRPRRRYGLLGTWTEWEGDDRVKAVSTAETARKRQETVDRRQNNGSVKAVPRRHCPATCTLRNCCFNCCAWTESQRQCQLHCCWWTTWTTRSKRGPTCSAQLHLPTHDLFWANCLKVQLHLPPLRSLDLLISPGTLTLLKINWCLMSSDVSWHIRDKLWPMSKHGSINLYVHGNQKAR